MAIHLPTHRTFGDKPLVRDASAKRRHNIDVSDRVPQVVRTRDRLRKLTTADATSLPLTQQPTIIVAATVQQLAAAAGAQGEKK